MQACAVRPCAEDFSIDSGVRLVRGVARRNTWVCTLEVVGVCAAEHEIESVNKA